MKTSEWVKKRKNLRQSILAFSRLINHIIVERLNASGFSKLKATHTTLLSNLDIEGATITECAARAGITKQAMGRLASELSALGFIHIKKDIADKRNVIMTFTSDGLALMNLSFEIMSDIEAECSEIIGKQSYQKFINSLEKLNQEMIVNNKIENQRNLTKNSP